MAPSWVFEAAVSAAGRRRHLERNAERTKANILAAAVAEFSDKGFAGARVDSIAEMAGCNKGMIYQYYGSKEHLYDEVIAYEYQTLSNIEAEIIQNHTDLRELIDVIVDRYFDFLLRHPDFVKIIMWENLNEENKVSLFVRYIPLGEGKSETRIFNKYKKQNAMREDREAFHRGMLK